MATQTQRPDSVTRWGLLITTLLLGVLLVGMGFASYLGARQTANAVIQSRAYDLIRTVRRELWHANGEYQAALEEVIVEDEDQGVRSVVLLSSKAEVIASAGEQIPTLSPAELRRVRLGSGPKVLQEEGRVRVLAPIGRGHGIPFHDEAFPGAGAWRKHGWAGGRKGGRWWKNRGPTAASNMRGFAVVEFEPTLAVSVVRRSLAMLIVSIIVSTMLLVAALFFWRASRRAERMQQQLAADRQLKVLGEMSAVLGHELRNPLAALKGHAQLLEEILRDKPGHKGAQTVVREAVRMEKLTEQILEFARTGTVDIAAEKPVDIVRSAEEQVEGDILIELEENLPEWPLDRIRIERVLINLLKNAVQCSPEGSPVELTTRTVDGGLLFEIRDHGEGLPPGEEQWIFEPFHTKRIRGTGLGLAVSKRIVDAHEGRIWAENHPQGGALFSVWLPPSRKLQHTQGM